MSTDLVPREPEDSQGEKPSQAQGPVQAISDSDRAMRELRSLLKETQVELGHTPEQAVIQLTSLAEAHIQGARAHIYSLGLVFFIVRDRQLYTHHPERFTSFREWLKQPGIEIAEGRASDIINLWRYGVPAMERAGLSPEEMLKIDESKLRVVIAPIKQAQDKGTPLSEEKIREFFTMAQTFTWEDLTRYVRPSSKHQAPDDNPDYDPEGAVEKDNPIITMMPTKRVNGNYDIVAKNLTEEDMEWITKRLRPIWVDPNTGEVLSFESSR